MEIRSKLTALCDAFNAHDLDSIMGFFADDCVLEMPRGNKPWGVRFEGNRGVREGPATRFHGTPDVHYGNAEHFVNSTADNGISKWTLTGTTREGKHIEVRGCDFYTQARRLVQGVRPGLSGDGSRPSRVVRHGRGGTHFSDSPSMASRLIRGTPVPVNR